MRFPSRFAPSLLSFSLAISVSSCAFAQTSAADQDHQNMMDQLGIKAQRPGWSGDEKAPNHANYDESKANPYPNLPDPLTLRLRANGCAEGDVDGDGDG